MTVHERRKKMRTSLICTLVITFSLFSGGTFSRVLPEIVVESSQIDDDLRASILDQNLPLFNDSLESGGDPGVLYENSEQGWVFCLATAPGKEEFLSKLISMGFDVNQRQTNIASDLSSPLACAISWNNFPAVKMLVESGADVAAEICLACDGRSPSSALSLAAIYRSYDMAVWLFDKGAYSEGQLETVVYLLENSKVWSESPQNIFRLQLIELFRKEGIDVDPWKED